jgi:orotidine-5'-phosphate decarboxylase
LQDLKVDGVPVYMKLAENIIKWHRPGVGAVVGATYLEELEKISKFFVNSKKDIPLLIPGVGSQGGSAREVVDALNKTGNDIHIHRINSSSGINYAYVEKDTSDYAKAAVDAIETLNKEIGL